MSILMFTPRIELPRQGLARSVQPPARWSLGTEGVLSCLRHRGRPGATGQRLFGNPEPRAGATVTLAMPGPLVDPRSLHDAIAREESRLLHLQTELGHAQARLAELKANLAAHEGAVETSPPAPSTALEKVALFRARFRGRDDIYPSFWSNARTGRKGYAPACQNEWIRGICEKPRVKCGECPNQAFLPVEDKVILDHLQGRHVVGVYPLLTDDTCWPGGGLR
jgi:hypothetical protein